MRFSISCIALMAASPLASAYVVSGNVGEKRHVGSLASYASRMVRDVLPIVQARDVPAPDAYGPWDTDVDEYGSWVSKVKREPHHTEAQIEAKKGKVAKQSAQANAKREPHHTAKQIEEKAKAAKESAQANAKREPHHTEAQIEAKEQAAQQSNVNANNVQKNCRRHHTEAQIEAKEKAQAQSNSAATQDDC